MLVEDDDAVRSIARRVLEQHGYCVIEAGDGAEALESAERLHQPVQLLATDVILPQLSGRELAERLTARWPAMKVLFLSGYMDDAILRHGVAHGHAPFLQKPYTPESLAQKVREVLDMPYANPASSAERGKALAAQASE
jgi:CheY-like chemotaxis protein